MIVSIGVNRIRKMVVERLMADNSSIEFGTAIHPYAVISPSATIDHYCVVADFCPVAPGAHINGVHK